jgi:hypothetical protein
MFMEEAEHFLKVVNGVHPICTLEDGVNVMDLLKNSVISNDHQEERIWNSKFKK